jgi:hypothetical protein
MFGTHLSSGLAGVLLLLATCCRAESMLDARLVDAVNGAHRPCVRACARAWVPPCNVEASGRPAVTSATSKTARGLRTQRYIANDDLRPRAVLCVLCGASLREGTARCTVRASSMTVRAARAVLGQAVIATACFAILNIYSQPDACRVPRKRLVFATYSQERCSFGHWVLAPTPPHAAWTIAQHARMRLLVRTSRAWVVYVRPCTRTGGPAVRQTSTFRHTPYATRSLAVLTPTRAARPIAWQVK